MSDQTKGKSTGAGAEAAEGLHSTGERDQTEKSGAKSARQHQSGYGGAGGTPKTSSDQREPENIAETQRRADSGSAQGDGSDPHDELGDEEAGDGLGNPDSSGARNIGKERDSGQSSK